MKKKRIFRSARIRKATYVSVWDDAVTVETDCMVDLDTREVFDIQKKDVTGIDMFSGEYVMIGDTRYAVYPETIRDRSEKTALWYRW